MNRELSVNEQNLLAWHLRRELEKELSKINWDSSKRPAAAAELNQLQKHFNNKAA